MNLSDHAASNVQVRQALLSAEGHVYTAARLTGLLDTVITEQAVRRWRKSNSADDPYVERTDRNVRAPKGWEPFAEEAGKVGSAVIRLPRPNATERDLLIGAGFDPDCWRIKGSINTRRWMRYDQEWLFYYKFDVEQGESKESKDLHVADLVKMIRRKTKPTTSFSNIDNPRTFAMVLSDWQIGKSEAGVGTSQTVARYKNCLAQAVANIKGLRKMGVVFDRLALLGVGDLVEGCSDHYAMQTFQVDCDRRTQNRIVRELLTETIITLAPLFKDVTVAVVGGNHGENRVDGQAHTTFADNDDVGCPEAVKEAFDLAGWNNITWYIPQHELTQCIDLDGVKIGLAHGHQFKGGVNALKKAEDWWRAHVFGMEPVNDAQILLSGHFHHHLNGNLAGSRSWMQAPTIDPGSQWYANTSGITSVPGVLTFIVDSANPLGYDFLRVLHPSRECDQVAA